MVERNELLELLGKIFNGAFSSFYYALKCFHENQKKNKTNRD
jgi:hypothetical protein